MKKLLFALAFCILIIGYSQEEINQNSQYLALLEKNVKQLDTIKSRSAYEDVLNKFDRLRELANEEWLPVYYSAYCKIELAGLGKESDAERLIDEALEQLEGIVKTDKNAEILTLLGGGYTKKIEVNMINGPTYTMKVKNTLKEAIEMDQNNPRAYMFYGMFHYYFPTFVGGDKEKGIKLFEKAELLFYDEYERNQMNYTYLPHWGKNLNLKHLVNSQ